MKKYLLLFLSIVLLNIDTKAQTSYTWNGGTTSWNTAANWTPVRTTPAVNDILIFNASNTVVLDFSSPQTIGQLEITGGSTAVTFQTGATRVLNIGAAIAGDDFTIDAGSSLTVQSTVATVNLTIAMGTGNTAKFFGAVNYGFGASATQAHRLTTPDGAGISFENGSSFTVIGVSSGSPFGTTGAAATNNNVVFKSGSAFNFGGGANAFGATAPASLVEFQSGSNFWHNASSLTATSGRYFGNFIVNANISGGGSWGKMDDLVVKAGRTFTVTTANNRFSITGNITVEATGAFTTSGPLYPDLLLIGTGALQTIDFGASTPSFRTISVGTDANVVFATNCGINPSTASSGVTSNIYGKLDLANKVLTGTAGTLTPIFINRSASTVATLVGATPLSANSNSIVSNNPSGISTGMLINFPGVFPANTYIIATSTGTFTTSKYSIASATTGTAFTISNNDATLSTSNTGGLLSALPGTYTYTLNGNLTFNGATTTPFPTTGTLAPEGITINAGVTLNRDLTVSGNLAIISGTLNTNNFNISIKGNWSNAGTFTSGTSTVTFNGSSAQTFSRTGTGTFNNLTIDNAAGVLLNNSATVTGALTFTAGNITTGANAVIISSTGSVAGGGTGWVIGNLQKNVATGATSRTFEIGGTGNYRPVTVDFASVSTAGNLTAAVSQSNAIYSPLAGSGLHATNNLRRFYTLTNSGIAFTNYDATFTFVVGDAVGTPGSYVVRKYNGSTWAAPVSSVATGTTTKGTGFTSFSDFVMGEEVVTNTWNGTGNWSNTGFWSEGHSPTGMLEDVVIATGTPTLDEDYTLANSNSLSITSGASLIIASTKSLTIAGLANFNGQSVTFKTDGTNTPGRLGPVTGTLSNASNVTVERYIPAGKRAYRQLSGGVNSTGDIRSNWQNGGTYIAGVGMHITGSTTGANGFDQTQTGAASLYTYTAGAANFTPIPNTDATNLKALQGYRVFMIGDRNADLTIANSSATGQPNYNFNHPLATTSVTLKATGTIVSGAVTYNSTTGATANGTTDGTIKLGENIADFALIGNPYWSPVDWELISRVNISQTYWIWDPSIGNRGAYTSYTTTSGSSGGGNIDANIQPGQAIFVRTTGASPSITFQEAHKSSEFTNTFRAANQTPSKMRIYLYTNTALANNGSMQDGATVAFRDDFSSVVDNFDATKFTNTDENIAIVRGTSVLGLEARPTVTAADTIPLRIWKLYSNNQYTLKLDGMDFDAGITGVLVDKKLNQEHVLNMSGNITLPFTFTASDSSSYYDRFMLVFRPSTTLPVNFTNVKAFTKNTGVQVEWNVAAEVDVVKYEVEKSANGTAFDKAGTITANNSKAYNWYDAMPNNGNNFYRIKVINKDNSTSYSNVVNVKLGNTKGDIVSVYPNPIKGNVLNVQFNNLEKGTYTVQLFNQTGQQVFSRSMSTDGGNMNQAMQLNKLAAGVYNMVVTGTQGIISTQKIIKEN